MIMSRRIKCEACGTRNFSADVYCRKCGGALYERTLANEQKTAYLFHKHELDPELSRK